MAGGGVVAAAPSLDAFVAACSPDFEVPGEEPAVCGPPGDLDDAMLAERAPSFAALALPAAEELPLLTDPGAEEAGGATIGAGWAAVCDAGWETGPSLPVPDPGWPPLAAFTPREPPIPALPPAWRSAPTPPWRVRRPAALRLPTAGEPGATAGAGWVRATPGWTDPTFAGAPGSGPLSTAGQPSWEMKTTRPRPIAPTTASIATDVRRSRNSMLPPASPRPPSDCETLCPTLEATVTTIAPSTRKQ